MDKRYKALPEDFPEEEKKIRSDAVEVIQQSRKQIDRAQNILALEVRRLGQLLERNQ